MHELPQCGVRVHARIAAYSFCHDSNVGSSVPTVMATETSKENAVVINIISSADLFPIEFHVPC